MGWVIFLYYRIFRRYYYLHVKHFKLSTEKSTPNASKCTPSDIAKMYQTPTYSPFTVRMPDAGLLCSVRALTNGVPSNTDNTTWSGEKMLHAREDGRRLAARARTPFKRPGTLRKASEHHQTLQNAPEHRQHDLERGEAARRGQNSPIQPPWPRNFG